MTTIKNAFAGKAAFAEMLAKARRDQIAAGSKCRQANKENVARLEACAADLRAKAAKAV